MADENDMNGELSGLHQHLCKKSGKVHMLGICGVGMAGLAFILKQQGFTVSGCDKSPNQLSKWLEQRGISVVSGHDASHIAGADWIIRSAAVQENIPELKAARKAGINIFRRGLVLAAISSAANSICVGGTHGKSTTTAMIVQMLKRAGQHPSYCIGGEASVLGGVAGWGSGDPLVVEADESDGTLAFYEPSITVITNIEFDHAEHFANMQALKKCFAKMVGRTRRKIIYCFDDKEARKICRGLRNTIAYGFSAGADLRLIKWRDTSGGSSCLFEFRGKPAGLMKLPVPGRHNILNAAAACAVGFELGIPFADTVNALAEYQPVARRFEKIVEKKDLLVIADYAHHPTEIAALLDSVRALKRKRWLAVFQPHRYSRTRALGKLFPPAFAGVDELVLCPVYEASEMPVPGGTVWDLYEHFRRSGEIIPLCARSLKQAWDYLKVRAARHDGILIVGAGDVDQIGKWAKAEIGRKKSWPLNQVTCWQNDLIRLRLKNSTIMRDEPMAAKTTLRVGGFADIFIEVRDVADLALIVRWAAANCVSAGVIGSGSNALVSDLGVRGIVMCLRGAAWQNIRPWGGDGVVVGAGVSLPRLTRWAAQHGKAGIEFLTGIPGTVGGAVRMNAGALGREIGSIIGWVRVMGRDGKTVILDKTNLDFAYRRCRSLKDKIVLEAALMVGKGSKTAINKQMHKILERRRWMAGLRSAGSIFLNPAGDTAGRLIESLGLKGRSIGKARISERHANVIMTENGASASDVLALIEVTRYLVKMKSGVDLVSEVEYFE